jgi:hypothetical protein
MLVFRKKPVRGSGFKNIQAKISKTNKSEPVKSCVEKNKHQLTKENWEFLKQFY